ncbi:MAG: aspartate carbamoyltransferase catalytic subunit [Phycisphaerae bacterium]|nr:aspartate carbamoyltransferase catalytic subunit [Phycisphaerae bacterium]
MGTLTRARRRGAGGRSERGAEAWGRRHLLQLRGMKGSELRRILSTARTYEAQLSGARGLGAVNSELRGRVVANLFFEDSTRTRSSFSVAARRLGAEVIDLTSVGSSVSKGETVSDTALNIAAMGVDAMVIRHRSSGACHLVVRTLEGRRRDGAAEARGDLSASRGCSIVNAGDGRHEHPTQGLLDIYTLAHRFGRLEDFDLRGLTVAIIGDVASSRVARSDIAGMSELGARVICVGPPGLVPTGLRSLGCEVSHDLDAVIGKVDARNVLRIQFERHDARGAAGGENRPAASSSSVIASIREYSELYGINARRAARMRRNAIVMHPGPINRGVELTADVADSQRSMVLAQVSHGVAVRMAVLSLCVGATA